MSEYIAELDRLNRWIDELKYMGGGAARVRAEMIGRAMELKKIVEQYEESIENNRKFAESYWSDQKEEGNHES